MTKLSKYQTFIKIAIEMSKLSKCVSHKVCSLIVKDSRIISTGINGTASGRINCCDYSEKMGWTDKNGKLISEFRMLHSDWSLKNELHAEINAICNAAKIGIPLDNSEMYCTLAPCVNCAKSISAAGIKKLYYFDEYYNEKYKSDDWKEILQESGVEVIKVILEEV